MNLPIRDEMLAGISALMVSPHLSSMALIFFKFRHFMGNYLILSSICSSSLLVSLA